MGQEADTHQDSKGGCWMLSSIRFSFQIFKTKTNRTDGNVLLSFVSNIAIIFLFVVRGKIVMGIKSS
jgi:hypothetical protein